MFDPETEQEEDARNALEIREERKLQIAWTSTEPGKFRNKEKIPHTNLDLTQAVLTLFQELNETIRTLFGRLTLSLSKDNVSARMGLFEDSEAFTIHIDMQRAGERLVGAILHEHTLTVTAGYFEGNLFWFRKPVYVVADALVARLVHLHELTNKEEEIATLFSEYQTEVATNGTWMAATTNKAFFNKQEDAIKALAKDLLRNLGEEVLGEEVNSALANHPRNTYLLARVQEKIETDPQITFAALLALLARRAAAQLLPGFADVLGAANSISPNAHSLEEILGDLYLTMQLFALSDLLRPTTEGSPDNPAIQFVAINSIEELERYVYVSRGIPAADRRERAELLRTYRETLKSDIIRGLITATWN
jgi:hypothetical protein